MSASGHGPMPEPTSSERIPVDRIRGGDVVLIPRYGGEQPNQPTYYAYHVMQITPIHTDGKREVCLTLTDDPTSGMPTRTLTIRPDTTILRRKQSDEQPPAPPTPDPR